FGRTDHSSNGKFLDYILVLTNQRWNASISTKWVILLKSVEHQEVKTEEREKATGRILSYMANEDENHALVADDVVPTEFALMAMSSDSI
ncbi:hypothetical protein Tco_0423078, partial [Tanacetum coccineum]